MRALAYQILGKCDVTDGRTIEGFTMLQRGIDVCTEEQCWAGSREHLELYLGMKLVETNHDRKRGINLVKKARTAFAVLGREDNLKEIDDWLAKHVKR
jgi:hypothetical protein